MASSSSIDHSTSQKFLSFMRPNARDQKKQKQEFLSNMHDLFSQQLSFPLTSFTYEHTSYHLLRQDVQMRLLELRFKHPSWKEIDSDLNNLVFNLLSINDLSKIEELDFSKMEIQGSAPITDVTLDNLNKLTNILSRSSSLKTLELRETLDGRPSSLTNMSTMSNDPSIMDVTSPNGYVPKNYVMREITEPSAGFYKVTTHYFDSPKGHGGNPNLSFFGKISHSFSLLQSLDLGNNGIASGEAIKSLNLNELPSLKKLSLSKNPLSEAAVNELAHWLEHNPPLIELDLSECNVLDATFSESTQSFVFNKIHKGISALSQMLRINTILEKLNLSTNREKLNPYEIKKGDVMTVELSMVHDALMVNNSLKELNLYRYLLSPAQIFGFYQAAERPESALDFLGDYIVIGITAAENKEMEESAPTKMLLSKFLAHKKLQRNLRELREEWLRHSSP